jgi:hypothetical protein
MHAMGRITWATRLLLAGGAAPHTKGQTTMGAEESVAGEVTVGRELTARQAEFHN